MLLNIAHADSVDADAAQTPAEMRQCPAAGTTDSREHQKQSSSGLSHQRHLSHSRSSNYNCLCTTALVCTNIYLEQRSCCAHLQEGGAQSVTPERSLYLGSCPVAGRQAQSLHLSSPRCLNLDAGLPLLPQLCRHSMRISSLGQHRQVNNSADESLKTEQAKAKE